MDSKDNAGAPTGAGANAGPGVRPIAKPKALAELLEFVEELCVRQTGKTFDEWSDLIDAKRVKALRSMRARGGRPYSAEDVMDLVNNHGFVDDDDFLACRCPVEIYLDHYPSAEIPTRTEPGGEVKRAETVMCFVLNARKFAYDWSKDRYDDAL